MIIHKLLLPVLTPTFCHPSLPPVRLGSCRLLLLLHGAAAVPRGSRLARRRGAGLRDLTAAEAAEVNHDAVGKVRCQCVEQLDMSIYY